MIACCWYGLSRLQDPTNNWVASNSLSDSSPFHQYAVCMNWAFAQLGTSAAVLGIPRVFPVARWIPPFFPFSFLGRVPLKLSQPKKDALFVHVHWAFEGGLLEEQMLALSDNRGLAFCCRAFGFPLASIACSRQDSWRHFGAANLGSVRSMQMRPPWWKEKKNRGRGASGASNRPGLVNR